MSEFKDDNYIYIKVKTEYSYFRTFNILYQGYSTKPTSDVSVNKSESYYSSSIGGIAINGYYNYYTLSFKIPKPSTSYLVFSPPGITIDLSRGAAYVISDTGLSTGAIIGIIAAVIVIVAIIIIVIYFVRRAKRNSYIAPPTVGVYAPPVVTVPPVQPAYPPPQTYY